MDISRRRLLQLGLLQAGITALPAHGSAEVEPPARRPEPSVVQGPTDATRTQFSIVHSARSSLRFEVKNKRGQTWQPDRANRYNLAGQPTSVYQVFFKSLSLGETYTLSIIENNKVIDEREFQTLNTAKTNLTFAVCSCMNEDRHEAGIWTDLVGRKPDFLIFAGDSTYCDAGGGTDDGTNRLWRRFSEARATLEIYFSRKLIPIFATWDDHDFGKNDTGRDYPYAKESLANFTLFFPMDPHYCSVLQRGPGVSSGFILGGQQFLLMDDRTWRVRGKSNERYAHWGQEQEEWMLGNIESHKGITWVVNGSQVFPQMIFKQSVTGQHPVQFAAVREALLKLDRKVGFISGDVHFSEISEIEMEMFGYVTYELTSSSIHSFKLPGLPGAIHNPRRIASTGKHNYLLVKSVAQGLGCRFDVESRSTGGAMNFSMQKTI